MLVPIILKFLLTFSVIIDLSRSVEYQMFDILIPESCESIAAPGDHILIEYEVKLSDGSIGSFVKRPQQLFHIILDTSVSTFSTSFYSTRLSRITI